MRVLRASVAAVAVAVTVLIGTSAQALPVAAAPLSYVEGTDGQAPVFNPMTVASIGIAMEQSAIDALSGDPRGAYQPATVTITRGSEVWGPYAVGLRLKGVLGSYRWLDQKAAFKLKINAVDPSLRYHGLKKLTVNNMVQDGSYIHEVLAYRIFRAVGIPAPRVGYSNVTFNGELFGLYALVETYDKPMLKRWFDSTKHLYEGSYWMDLAPGNAPAFEVDEGSSLDRRDLEELITVANSNRRWWDSLGRVTDRHEFLREWATELFIGHWDGYAATIKNNYFLHSDTAGRFTLMPWGADQTFSDYLSYTDTWDRSILFTRCMAVDACWRDFHVALSEVLAAVQRTDLAGMIVDVSAAIHDALLADPRRDMGGCDDACRVDQTANAEWLQQEAGGFIANRTTELRDYLSQMLPGRPTVTVRPSARTAAVSMNSTVDSHWTVSAYEIQTRSHRQKWHALTTSSESVTVIPRTRQLGSVIRVRAVTQLGVSPWSAAISVAR